MRKVLPTITTTRSSNWKEKIKEIDKLGLKEVALFPTCLDKKERNELYSLIQQTGLERIPFVHLRNDFDEEEIGWLKEKYKTQVFNTHSERSFPLKHSWDKYKKKCIYLENTHFGLLSDELDEYAGICLDFSHLENDRLLFPKRYSQVLEMIKNYKVGCAHLSAIRNEQHLDPQTSEELRYDWHQLEKLSEMDYLKNYPQDYFPEYIAIELENSLEEQTKIKDYIENILKIFS